MQKAATLLHLQPDYSITRIALETGFSSLSAFSRVFIGHFKTTAKDYRKKAITNRLSSFKKISILQNIGNMDTIATYMDKLGHIYTVQLILELKSAPRREKIVHAIEKAAEC